MTGEKKLIGDNLLLRPIQISDCSQRYLSWLQDPQISKYLETRWTTQTMESIQSFVASKIESDSDYLFAIIEKETGQHMGNIKIGPVNSHHKYADVSYFIGEKSCWGKGYATEAIRLITRFGFEELGLYKVQAGVYENNIGSIKALKKVGFVQEGCLRKQLLSDGNREDHLLFGIFEDEVRG